jgi:hypothetical protein
MEFDRGVPQRFHRPGARDSCEKHR